MRLLTEYSVIFSRFRESLICRKQNQFIVQKVSPNLRTRDGYILITRVRNIVKLVKRLFLRTFIKICLYVSCYLYGITSHMDGEQLLVTYNTKHKLSLKPNIEQQQYPIL